MPERECDRCGLPIEEGEPILIGDDWDGQLCTLCWEAHQLDVERELFESGLEYWGFYS